MIGKKNPSNYFIDYQISSGSETRNENSSASSRMTSTRSVHGLHDIVIVLGNGIKNLQNNETLSITKCRLENGYIDKFIDLIENIQQATFIEFPEGVLTSEQQARLEGILMPRQERIRQTRHQNNQTPQPAQNNVAPPHENPSFIRQVLSYLSNRPSILTSILAGLTLWLVGFSLPIAFAVFTCTLLGMEGIRVGRERHEDNLLHANPAIQTNLTETFFADYREAGMQAQNSWTAYFTHCVTLPRTWNVLSEEARAYAEGRATARANARPRPGG